MPFKSHYPPLDFPRDSFTDQFLRALRLNAARTPGKAAMISAENPNDRVSYAELYTHGHSVAAFLNERHFGVGDVACVVLSNCWEFIAIFTGVALQGGAISGASYLFTDYELKRQFLDSKSKVIFCSENTLERVRKAAGNSPYATTIVVVSDSPDKTYPFGVTAFRYVLQTHSNFTGKERTFDVEKTVLLLPYSSGTTGSPKGVMLTHSNFTAMMVIIRHHYNHHIVSEIDDFHWTKENLLMFLPFYHVYGFGLAILGLLEGATAVVMKQFNVDIFLQSLQQYRVRMLNLVPPILVTLAKNPSVDKYDLRCLRFLLSGAAPAGAELCESVKKRLPHIQHITQGFGMSELSMASHFATLDKPRYDSVGKLASNLEQKIVDVESREELPTGQRGEICIRGPTVMAGYLNRPKATEETIDEDGWLRTGDIGYIDEEGYLYIVDRLKELIKVKGLQVPPAELEDLLLSHPHIQDCAVIGIADASAGEVPKAFVVRSHNGLTESEVFTYVKEKVAHYKSLKGGVEFIDEIPKSAAGKILRRLLKERELASAKRSKL